MSKPTIANSRWATSSTNSTSPSSGQRDSGIVVGAATVSSYVNYLLNQFYLWMVWIDGSLNASGFPSGTRTKKLSFADGTPTDPTTANGLSAVVGNGYLTQGSGAAAVWMLGLGLNVGDRILAVRFCWKTSGTSDIWTGVLTQSNGDGTATGIGTVTSTTGGSAVNETKTITVGSPAALVSDNTCPFLHVAATASGMHFYSVEVDYDHP